ncbi:glycosyltransferase family 2 protein [Roseisalinus antarcticus]|uniref:Putative glycosyl transferase n=1 Tax=Roseisalinus antarcticus TaxID=254357 RepID=A0A1Y5SA20_9RHOB|nr:glycosyltransferase [Roseisalinus antarcticus]SLN33021.1 putative glycosyl transferase [Roseisalinus antarcticus]
MTRPNVSVVVVSNGRPDALIRCLRGLTQLVYDPFEVVAVADRPGRRRIDTRPELFGRIKVVACDEPNISVARNLGIAQAAGEVIAFIDDDAVPEPLWLAHLAPVFEDRQVGAATGYVIGRNGISLQHRLRDVGPDADSRPVSLQGGEPRLVTAAPGRAVKTEGTNMAFRREVLLRVSGFDPAFRFYLDETDLDMRLAALGTLTAAVPHAQVHHQSAASDRRRPDRVPRSLHDVGASLAMFLRRHSSLDDIASVGRKERRLRHRSLLEHMVAGRIEPRDVGRILATFDAGWAEGSGADLLPLPPLEPAPPAFLRYRPDVPRRGHAVVAGRIWQGRARRAEALRLVEAGWHTTLFLLSPTARYHRAWFDDEGYWIQRGGLFGRSRRGGRLVQFWRFHARIRNEIVRLRHLRGRPAADMDNH